MRDEDKTKAQLIEELTLLRVQAGVGQRHEQRIAELSTDLEQQISARNRAEQSLQESEEQLRLFTESAFEGIVITDLSRELRCRYSCQSRRID